MKITKFKALALSLALVVPASQVQAGIIKNAVIFGAGAYAGNALAKHNAAKRQQIPQGVPVNQQRPNYANQPTYPNGQQVPLNAPNRMNNSEPRFMPDNVTPNPSRRQFSPN